MQIIIKSIHFTAGPDLENYVRDKVEDLTKLNNRIVRAHITLSIEAGNNSESKVCEIVLSIPGEDPYLKKMGSSFEEAVNLAVDAMQKVLRRLKPR